MGWRTISVLVEIHDLRLNQQFFFLSRIVALTEGFRLLPLLAKYKYFAIQFYTAQFINSYDIINITTEYFNYQNYISH